MHLGKGQSRKLATYADGVKAFAIAFLSPPAAKVTSHDKYWISKPTKRTPG